MSTLNKVTNICLVVLRPHQDSWIQS